MAFGNWVTLYAGAKHELLFNKSVVGLLNIQEASEAGLLNKSSCSAAALGVSKFINVRYDFGHNLL
jgi:hypothetical protein